jgi:branched-chain amino acid transport system ATP-binding protein
MPALREVSLETQESEFVCVIGPNGAGKTTLLHSICGVTPIRNGRIVFMDEVIHRLNAGNIVSKGISLVPEGRRVFAPLTVNENLMMGAYTRLRRENKEGIQKDLQNVFDIFPVLRDRVAQLAGELSGGEQQMLAIARALMSRPKLLLLDEPSMGLAPLLVRKIFDVLASLREVRTTLLLVEQNARIALQISDRGYVLERGRVAAQGQREELLRDEAIKKAYLGE